MKVQIKSPEEIALMREAGRILAQTHEELFKALKPGMTTLDIDRLGESIIRDFNCIPSFLNYNGYPASICVSLNDEVVHGIPSADRVIREGDLVSLDAGVIYRGYHSDAARSYVVGDNPEAQKLIDVTRQSFFEGIKYARAGNHLRDIARGIQTYAQAHGYSVVRDLMGHGIGTHLHEEPGIPNFVTWKRGVKLKPGMTLAVEPMLNQGDWDVDWLDDEWTVVTYDGSLSAHYENTILITEGEPEILSRADNIKL